MRFRRLTLHGLIHTGALTTAVSEANLNGIKLLSNGAIKDTGTAPIFEILVAKDRLERLIGTVLLELKVADFHFYNNFGVMRKTSESTL